MVILRGVEIVIQQARNTANKARLKYGKLGNDDGFQLAFSPRSSVRYFPPYFPFL